MLERTDAITNEVLEPITFVLYISHETAKKRSSRVNVYRVLGLQKAEIRDLHQGNNIRVSQVVINWNMQMR
jgi:hypothetical protein